MFSGDVLLVDDSVKLDLLLGITLIPELEILADLALQLDVLSRVLDVKDRLALSNITYSSVPRIQRRHQER